MRLDAADLAGLEIDAYKLGSLSEGIIQHLIEEIRERDDYESDAEHKLVLARDDAREAAMHLKALRRNLAGASSAADRAADDIEECLDRIRRL